MFKILGKWENIAFACGSEPILSIQNVTFHFRDRRGAALLVEKSHRNHRSYV